MQMPDLRPDGVRVRQGDGLIFVGPDGGLEFVPRCERPLRSTDPTSERLSSDAPIFRPAFNAQQVVAHGLVRELVHEGRVHVHRPFCDEKDRLRTVWPSDPLVAQSEREPKLPPLHAEIIPLETHPEVGICLGVIIQLPLHKKS